jgi:isopentenyl-diphosphate Delta-isomerase
MESRKKDHIELALKSRTESSEVDPRFVYEPMLSGHPQEAWEPFPFLGKIARLPMWVSSMTGGTEMAGIINRNLARACNEFGMGMGLGSCRIILEDDAWFHQFDVRDIAGPDVPLFANLGINQVETLLEKGKTGLIDQLLKRLRADGLIVHVNPLQEWFQPEGDRLKAPPIEIVTELVKQAGYKIIVKEVGQGMGPESLRALLKLPIEAIEFAAFGGTNFAKVELFRSDPATQELFEPLTKVGETAVDMLGQVNGFVDSGEVRCKSLILSGGVQSFLDGYYLVSKSKLPAVYGQASAFLKHARGEYPELKKYIEKQVWGLSAARAFLRVV